jgi:hypothetical protein
MPPAKPYHFHPEAWQEFEAADDWYRQESPDSCIRFVAAIYDALEDIARWPQAWPAYRHGTRKFVLQKFPTPSSIERRNPQCRFSRLPTAIASRDIGRVGSNQPVESGLN